MEYFEQFSIIAKISSIIPILILIITMTLFKWSGQRSGTAGLIASIIISFIFFGSTVEITVLSFLKGISLSLFVLSIIWSAVWLYNLTEQNGSIKNIASVITSLISNPLHQALIIGWCFSGLIQGIAGFGVPIAVIVPLLVIIGINPFKASAIALIGHSWAVAFGSLGSSYYTLQLMTNINTEILAPHLAILFFLPIFLSGLSVSHIHSGWKGIINSLPLVLSISIIMALSQYFAAKLNSPQIASTIAGLLGCIFAWIIINRTKFLKKYSTRTKQTKINPDTQIKTSIHMSLLPYYLLIFFSLSSQIPIIKEIGGNLFFAIDIPSTVTNLGFATNAIQNFAKIKLLSHPAPIILVSLFLFWIANLRYRNSNFQDLKKTFFKTYYQCVPTTLTTVSIVVMAMIMTTTGMTTLISMIIANNTGNAFPVFSPFIGALGTFISGSNTSSNIMFGALQLETATKLGIGIVTISSIQTIGGSIASSIAPAKILVGTAIVGINGKEGEVFKKTIPYCILILLMIGLEAWIFSYLLKGI
ncbi:MAG: L-lactate permease [SAR202 cluster bacterium]|nr:L-lactate permease [SAR202 cluster bacterium]